MPREIDFNSPTWRAVERYAQQQITVLREKNDSQGLDVVRTADIRGRIAAWKELLALADPAPVPTADAGGY